MGLDPARPSPQRSSARPSRPGGPGRAGSELTPPPLPPPPHPFSPRPRPPASTPAAADAFPSSMLRAPAQVSGRPAGPGVGGRAGVGNGGGGGVIGGVVGLGQKPRESLVWRPHSLKILPCAARAAPSSGARRAARREAAVP